MTMTSETTKPKYAPVAERFRDATGVAPCANTISRLIITGRLRALKITGRWVCTEEAFMDYAEAASSIHTQPAQAAAAAPRTRSDAARIKAQAEAIAYLDANGIS